MPLKGKPLGAFPAKRKKKREIQSHGKEGLSLYISIGQRGIFPSSYAALKKKRRQFSSRQRDQEERGRKREKLDPAHVLRTGKKSSSSPCSILCECSSLLPCARARRDKDLQILDLHHSPRVWELGKEERKSGKKEEEK